MHHVHGIIGLFFLLIWLAFAALFFVFWLWMLIDAIQNPRLDGTQKVVWVLVVIFLPFLGPIIYFFAGRSART